MVNKQPISLSGLPVTAGLKPVANPRPSAWKRITYDQNGTIVDNVFNICRLEKTEGLNGWERKQAICRNVGAITANPFALAEYWRHLLSTGKMV